MNVPTTKLRSIGEWAKLVLIVAVVWVLLGGLLIVFAWPNYPSSVSGWALILIAGPPIYLLEEWLAQKFWSSQLGRGISDYPPSSGRIILGVVAFLIVIGLGLLILNVVSPWLLATLKTLLK